jgi:hypothetical protein
MLVEPVGTYVITLSISQSPAVRERLVAFAATAVVSEVAVLEAVRYSPTCPAAAFPPATVPTRGNPPRAVNAAAAVVCPVPPSAIGMVATEV